MFINLLAFTLGVVFWTVVVCAHPKIIAFLPKIFDKVLPKFSSLMLSYVLALFFYAILFMSPRYYKFWGCTRLAKVLVYVYEANSL